MDDADLTNTSHIILCVYIFLILLVGLLGNLYVLYSSLKHGALHLDAASLVLVHALAVSDITANLLIVLPMFITLVAKRWVLGSGICGLAGFFFTAPLQSNTMIILTATGLFSIRIYFRHFNFIAVQILWLREATKYVLINCKSNQRG
jgi:hypothetical protein